MGPECIQARITIDFEYVGIAFGIDPKINFGITLQGKEIPDLPGNCLQLGVQPGILRHPDLDTIIFDGVATPFGFVRVDFMQAGLRKTVKNQLDRLSGLAPLTLRPGVAHPIPGRQCIPRRRNKDSPADFHTWLMP